MKGLFQSKTIWGAVIAIAGAIASQRGWASENEVAQWAEIIAQLVGAGMVVYGRIKAQGPISGLIK
jgi:hypothetical protein